MQTEPGSLISEESEPLLTVLPKEFMLAQDALDQAKFREPFNTQTQKIKAVSAVYAPMAFLLYYSLCTLICFIFNLENAFKNSS